MATPETYYYGQGKVFLARRHNRTGKPLAWRWVGDVSALSVALTVENITHQESYSGQRATVRRIAGSKDGSLTATWHEHSPENLALLLYGDTALTPAGSVTGEELPEGIKAGERYTLDYQNVSDVVLTIPGSDSSGGDGGDDPKAASVTELKEGEDYTLDEAYGAIEFLVDMEEAPKVAYSHAACVNTSMFTEQPEDLAFRFEGINLAENGAAVIVELYKINFDPTSALGLINNDTSLAGLDTTAGILMDTSRASNALLGRFGRVIHVKDREE